MLKIILTLILLADINETSELQRGAGMPNNSYESMFAKKVKFAQWRDLVKGPESRFHSAFAFELPPEQWKCVDSNSSRMPEEFVLNYVEKKYLSVSDPNRGLLVRIALCESIRSSHGFLFTTIAKFTNPAYPLNYPGTVDIGDVYFSGYWARDNLFICVESFLSVPVEDSEINKICSMIDAKLIKVPDFEKQNSADAPVIAEFQLQAKTIPVGENVPIRFAVRNKLHSAEQCKILFSVSGGTVSYKSGIYFYKADSLGKHDIHLYVTDPSGTTSHTFITVTVVE